MVRLLLMVLLLLLLLLLVVWLMLVGVEVVRDREGGYALHLHLLLLWRQRHGLRVQCRLHLGLTRRRPGAVHARCVRKRLRNRVVTFV